MYFIGYDIGSSSIKAALVEAKSGKKIAITQSPDLEMAIEAPEHDFAEQDPAIWWQHVITATQRLKDKYPQEMAQVAGIGIAYQMHGLVLLDQQKEVIRPAIIWCDSRAVALGNEIAETLGSSNLMDACYNLPGNFTFSKLLWVKEHEPHNYQRIWKMMLPGDYIAFKLTETVSTSFSGLSEGILWDFAKGQPAYQLLDQYEIPHSVLPEIHPSFFVSGHLSSASAEVLGLAPGIPVSYRAGDQPNNAFSLNVNEPGILAATGGTSGVLYGISDQPIKDQKQQTNSFAHVNYHKDHPTLGTLLCINGAGIMYSWIRKNITGQEVSYFDLENRAAKVAAGSDGLLTLPFGNGAERMFNNQNIGCQWIDLDLNRHHKEHLIRSGLEGIAFAFVYGLEVMQSLGLQTKVIRTGNDNLFQSEIFCTTIAQLGGVQIDIVEATGAVGAALGAGVGVSYYDHINHAFQHQKVLEQYFPGNRKPTLVESYTLWKEKLKNII